MTEMESDVGINNDHRIEKGHFLYHQPNLQELEERERIKAALDQINKIKKTGTVLNDWKIPKFLDFI